MSFCDEKAFSATLCTVFGQNGLASLLSSDVTHKFYELTERMLTVNEQFNLTAITDPDKIILNHYADCATLAKKLPRGAKVIDVGCGAGFPTLPVALLRPDVSVYAIDSTAKKVAYVAETAAFLGLSNVKTASMRAEDVREGAKNLRESFDVATARAVAELRVLAELCLPYVKVGGKMIAMKGKNAQNELSDAKRAIAILGGKLSSVEENEIRANGESISHPLITIDKVAKTPATYPRVYAQISKKPL